MKAGGAAAGERMDEGSWKNRVLADGALANKSGISLEAGGALEVGGPGTGVGTRLLFGVLEYLKKNETVAWFELGWRRQGLGRKDDQRGPQVFFCLKPLRFVSDDLFNLPDLFKVHGRACPLLDVQNLIGQEGPRA